MIGHRLTKALAAKDMTPAELHTKTKERIPVELLVKYQNDKESPDSSHLIILADALDVPIRYLLNDRKISLDAIFRKKQPADTHVNSMLDTYTTHALDNYLEVEEMLGVHNTRWNRPKGAPYHISDMSDVERAADNLRNYWNIGEGPINNVIRLLEEQNIKVISTDMTDIDGALVTIRQSGMEDDLAIVVDNSVWGERQRFTICHELGHMILSCANHDDIEKAAHRFAGAFLMPESTLRKSIDDAVGAIDIQRLQTIKRMFGASMQAITYRCYDLGIISKSVFEEMFNEFERQGWRKPPYMEPHTIPAEEPTRFRRMVCKAFTKNMITQSKAAELLGIYVSELNDYLKDYPLPETEPTVA